MIVTVGENVIDLFKRTDGRYQAIPGGSPLNIAIALGRLGVKVGYASPISNDPFGDDMVKLLEANGGSYMATSRVDRPTGLALIAVRDDGQPDYSFYLEGSAYLNLAKAELPTLGEDVLHIEAGGSLVFGNPTSGDVIVEWLLSQDERISISLDPNVRSNLIKDRDAFLKRCEALYKRCAVVRMSIEDSDYMYDNLSADEVLDKLLSFGVGLASVTCGAENAYLATKDHRVEIKTIKYGDVIDTVAAGDCFLAAVLYKLYSKQSLAKEDINKLTKEELFEIGTFAAATSALNCAKEGCDPPNLQAIEGLLATLKS